MNTNETKPIPDDIVTNIVEVFEVQTIPSRPSNEETSTWISETKEPDVSPLHPVSVKKSVVRFIAPLAAVAAGIACLVFYGAGGSNAFAQVIEQIVQRHTVKFSIAIEQPGKPRLRGEAIARRPQLLRIDWTVKGQSNVNVTNYQRGELISYRESSDVTVYSIPSAGGFDVVRQLEKVDAQQTKQIPDSENRIDDTDLFEFKEGAMTGRLWIDRQTRLPVRMETNTPAEIGGGRVIYSNFEWDVEIADAVFEIPAGRNVVRDNLLAEPTEEELIAALQIRQAFSSKSYPADFLHDQAGLTIGRLAYDHKLSRAENYQRQWKMLKPHLATIGLTDIAARDPAIMQKRIDYLCMKADQWDHTIEEFGGWVGEGIIPGEDKPLCWWKLPGKGIRVLYADLKIRDAQVAP